MKRLLLAASLMLSMLGATSLVFVGGSNVAQAADEPLDPKVKPDAVLSAGQTVTFKHTTPLLGSQFSYSPAQCRGTAPVDPTEPDALTAPLVCKAYRIAINVDPNPKANNVVMLTAEFDQIQAPSLAVVAAGLNPPPINGVDVYVYDFEDHYLGQNAPGILDPVAGPGDPEDVPPGSSSFNVPERGGFKVKHKLYDIVVNAETGVNKEFTLRVTYSNEIFKTPDELLDDPAAFGGGTTDDASTPNGFLGGFNDGSIDPELPALDLAPINPDSDIAGIGLGVNEQFDPTDRLSLGGATRSISASKKAPSALILVFAMILVPLGVGGAAVLGARRRQRGFIA